MLVMLICGYNLVVNRLLRHSVDVTAGEMELINYAQELGAQNKVWRSYIGLGYHNCRVPHAILRNIFENPGW